MVRLRAGLTPRRVRELAGDAMRFELGRPKTGIRPYAEMRTLMDALKGRRFEVWIISASGQFVVERVARELFGAPPGMVIGAWPLLAAGDSDDNWEMLDHSADFRIVIDRGKAVTARARKRAARGERWLLQTPFAPN